MCKALYCNSLPIPNHQGYCQSCYNYFILQKKKQYQPTEHGKMSYSPDGEPICHLCGKSYTKLGQHVLNKHGVNPKLYKQHFGLYNSQKLTKISYQKKMRDYTEKYKDLVIKENLTKKGKKTRYKNGEVHATSHKKVRSYHQL